MNEFKGFTSAVCEGALRLEVLRSEQYPSIFMVTTMLDSPTRSSWSDLCLFKDLVYDRLKLLFH